MDDPRQILAEAGVECPEVEAWERACDERRTSATPYTYTATRVEFHADAAILALARGWADAENRAAKYKWQRDYIIDEFIRDAQQQNVIDELDRMWSTVLPAPPAEHLTADGCRPSASS